MILYKKHIISSKPYTEAYDIIKSFAFRKASTTFSQNAFSMVCIHRIYPGWRGRLHCVNGVIFEQEKGTEISIYLKPGFMWFAGTALAAVGMLCVAACLLAQDPRWGWGSMIMVAGLVSTLGYYFRGKRVINQLAEKLI